MSFQIGDTVEWSSSSNGSERLKQGKIVYIFPPNIRPALYPERTLLPEIEEFLKQKKLSFSTSFLGGGPKRDEESYLIIVPGGTGRSKNRLYWPKVSWLKKI